MLQCGKAFFACNTTVYKFVNFTGLYCAHFTILCNQTSQRYQIKGTLSNCLMNVPNSKICVIGIRSIGKALGRNRIQDVGFTFAQCIPWRLLA